MGNKFRLWFIPLRMGHDREKTVMRAKSIEDATKKLKTSKYYYKNFDRLPPTEQEKPWLRFMLEDEYFDTIYPKAVALWESFLGRPGEVVLADAVDIKSFNDDDLEAINGEIDASPELKRFPQKVLQCKHRYYYHNQYGDTYCCNFINRKQYEENRGLGLGTIILDGCPPPKHAHCIILDEHYKDDLPKDCPYLKQESEFIDFVDPWDNFGDNC